MFWLRQRQGQVHSLKGEAERIKEMPGIQELTPNWNSGLPFITFRAEKSEKDIVFLTCDGWVYALFCFAELVSNLQSL